MRTVAVVRNRNDCPPGTRAVPVAYPSVYGVPSSVSQWECVAGEGLLCEWFGWFCQGPVVNPPAAPSTVPELSQPSQWTPEKSAQATQQQYQENVDLWLESTSGAAQFQSGLHEAGEAIESAVPWALIGLAVAGFVVFKILSARVRV